MTHERRQHIGVGRHLDGDLIPGLGEETQGKRDPLACPVTQHELLGGHGDAVAPKALRHRPAKPRIAFGGRVREERRPLLPERGFEAGRELFDRIEARVGDQAMECNDVVSARITRARVLEGDQALDGRGQRELLVRTASSHRLFGRVQQGSHEGPGADSGFDEAGLTELLVGESDRIAVKSELCREGPDRRQAVPGRAHPALDLRLKLGGDLEVDRLIRSRVDAEVLARAFHGHRRRLSAGQWLDNRSRIKCVRIKTGKNDRTLSEGR